MAKIIVTEVQKFANDQISTPSYAYDDMNAAEAKFHSVLASAAVSQLPVHSCIMFSEEGFPLRHECYKHDAVTPEPEGEGE